MSIEDIVNINLLDKVKSKRKETFSRRRINRLKKLTKTYKETISKIKSDLINIKNIHVNRLTEVIVLSRRNKYLNSCNYSLYNENMYLQRSLCIFKEKSKNENPDNVKIDINNDNIVFNIGDNSVKIRGEIISENIGYCYLCIKENQKMMIFKCGHGTCCECVLKNMNKKLDNMKINKCLICR